jgi:hypothetical protein
MEQVVIFDKFEAKKHSVCYKTSQENPAVTSIYVMKSALPNPYPKKLKVVLMADE